MATYSLYSSLRPKITSLAVPASQPAVPLQSPVSALPALTISSIRDFSSRISKKPVLITSAELQSLGLDIKLVGYDPLAGLITNASKPFTPRILNWVEPYEVAGIRKTLFYTEVNSELKVGDRVFIINGNYDSDLLIQKDKYRKGRDGYKVLYVENCKIVLDIDYTGVNPYNNDPNDSFIKIYYIRNQSEFISANREITTKSGILEYKYSYYQNNIAFIDNNYLSTGNWGLNGGVSGTPGFFVKNGTQSWTDITNSLINLGTYSFALSPNYYNNDRIKIMNADFTYNGQLFQEGFVYKWVVGPTNSIWKVDQTYSRPFITKNNFRDGNFRGVWNSGLFGQQNKRITWDGDGSTWNIGSLLNTTWKKGQIKSLYSASQSYFASFDSAGYPYQKVNSPNNAGRGYNFIVDSNIEKATIDNGSVYKTKIGPNSSTYSVIENQILNQTVPFSTEIKSAFFNDCVFSNSYITNSELKNTRGLNSKFEKVKSINSYFINSTFKDSNYNSEKIIKILAYDELVAAEHPTISSTYSSIYDSVQKVYKFYINKESYDRLRTSDVFYIKGLRVNDNKKEVINFFDKKFRLSTWTEYNDEVVGGNFVKVGYECSAFLSTPFDNSYKFSAVYDNSFNYYTNIYATNSNSNYYSIDIWVKRFDISNNAVTFTTDFTSGSVPALDTINTGPSVGLGISLAGIDVTNAYIVDCDFESGLFENSDWNSGYHIGRNNDANITVNNTSGGTYQLSITPTGNIIATTSYNILYPEEYLAGVGDIIYLDSVDFNDGVNITRIPDSYKILSSNNGTFELQEIVTGTTSILSSLTQSTGYFYTKDAQNRYGTFKRLKIKESNIKSGLLRRTLITGSLIQNSNFDQFDKDFNNLDKIRDLVISDSIFSNKSNTLSFGTYVYSSFLTGSDNWYSGIIQDSIWNGPTFSNGVFKSSRWVDGVFQNGYFYKSKTFNSTPTATSPFYYSENINSYYKDGSILPNNRNSWQGGRFLDGIFEKSDWEMGTFSSGRFIFSDWYDGVITNGVIGSNQLSVSDTRFYNGTVSYATVENASLYASDTSFTTSVPQNIVWINGVFNNGLFGTNINQSLNNQATWYNGLFTGGQFISLAKWKNGIFNGGKFTSGFGWSQSNMTTANYYGWENGKFNNGEFGNGQGLTNSTWYTGEFNGGIFKGRTWNDGVFLYGEFKGSGSQSTGGTTCSNASDFVDSYSYSYYGEWRNGIFTDKKDKFIKDEKMFSVLKKANVLEKRKPISIISNALWYNGTFSHPGGEMNNCVWLDGTFERGKFKDSSFNPYVKRNGSSSPSFNFNDETCYWENGEFDGGEFYVSKWKDGKFIIGTAVGMIWQNGVNNYMNAFNIYWEKGLWRNGNWYGSSFELNGEVTDDYTKQILFRGMSWSGTSSCHIWNIFKTSAEDIEPQIINATASAIGSNWKTDDPDAPIAVLIDLGGGGKSGA